MPRGIKGSGPKAEDEKPKRKYTRREKGETGDLKALAQAQLVAAGQLLRAAIEDGIELEAGDSVLRGAIDNYDRAQKLAAAVK